MAQQCSGEPHRKQRTFICSRRSFGKLDVLIILQRHSCSPCRVDTVVRRRPPSFLGESAKILIAALNVKAKSSCGVNNLPTKWSKALLIAVMLSTSCSFSWRPSGGPWPVCAISTNPVNAWVNKNNMLTVWGCFSLLEAISDRNCIRSTDALHPSATASEGGAIQDVHGTDDSDQLQYLSEVEIVSFAVSRRAPRKTRHDVPVQTWCDSLI